MTALRDALAIQRLNTMRRRRAQQARLRCQCAACAAARGEPSPVTDLLRALREGVEILGEAQTPPAGTTLN